MLRNNNSGYVLMMTLIILQITMSMSLYALLSVARQIQANRDRWVRMIDDYAARQELGMIEKKLYGEGVACFISVQSSYDFVHKGVAWWQQTGCHYDVGIKKYYYTVENLGMDECGLMGKSSGNLPLVAQYYRITLYALISNRRLILQSTLAIAGHNHLSCASMVHVVMPGRQMLRVLYE